MALDTYSNLKASVIAFSGRDDLSSQMDDFISLAEEAIYFNDVFPLRLQSMEHTDGHHRRATVHAAC